MQGEVSVVIPTLNAEDRISQLIISLRNQTLKPLEIYIIDSSSDDRTVEIAKAFDGVKIDIIDRLAFNHGLTRHKALMQTSGDYICFLTDDAVPANNSFLANLLDPLEDSSVAMASGRQLPKPDARRYEQLVRLFNYTNESNVRAKADLLKYGIKTFFATDVCSIYRRTTYLKIGGFQEVNTNEDMLIAAHFINAGYKVAYAANAEVYHSHNLTARQQFERYKAIGLFLEIHANDLLGVGEVGEGSKLALDVTKQLLKERRIIELFAFGVDCIARYFGNRTGRIEARKARRGQ